jgi:hypothetical protein
VRIRRYDLHPNPTAEDSLHQRETHRAKLVINILFAFSGIKRLALRPL